MKTIYLILSTITIFNTYSQCALDYSKFTPIWTEDFNGTMEDVEVNWQVGSYSWGDFNDHKNYRTSGTTWKDITFISDKSNMQVSNGIMHMKNTMLPNYQYRKICEVPNDPATCKNYRIKYTYSTMETTIGELFGEPKCDTVINKGGWLYGLFEVRCKIPKDEMMFSTFWMLPSQAGSPEVDIFEVDNYCPTENLADCESFDFKNGVSPYNGTPGTNFSHNFFRASNLNFYDEFHTWSMLWSPDKITFYLDGNEFRTWYGSLDETGPLGCEWRRMRIILTAKPSAKAHYPTNYGKFNPNNEFEVDWVKVSKPTNGSYLDNEIPALVANNINPSITNIEDNIKMGDNTLYYWNRDDDKLTDLYYNASNSKWEPKNSFISFPHQVKQEPVYENSTKIYYKGNADKLYNFYKSGGIWHNAMISNEQKIKDKYYTSDFVGFEHIVYTDMDRKLKHFLWLNGTWMNYFLLADTDQGKKANDNFIVKDDFVFYEGRKNILGVWWRDKHLWVGNKTQGTFVSQKFSTELYTQGTSFKIKNFACNANGHRVFFITENNQLRYHQYNAATNTWSGDNIMDDGVQNVFDNLIVSNNGNQVFYTNSSGHIFNFYLIGSNWYNTAINYNNKVDIDDVNHLSYDEAAGRLYFTTTYINPSLFPTSTNGVLNYFQWSNTDNQWHYKQIRVTDNPTNSDSEKGRVNENVQLLDNGNLLYTDKRHNGYIVSTPEVCTHLNYPGNTYINGMGSNKTDGENVIENYFDESEIEIKPLSGTGVVEEGGHQIYYEYNENVISINLIESIYPNTTRGKFNVVFLDSVLIKDGSSTRNIQILKPYSNEIFQQKTVPASEKVITFDISTAPEGNYSVVVTEENGNLDSKVLIKIN